MVPRKFNIVDFDGFDLASHYGEVLPGIYDKIVDAHWNCVYIMCFGLKFGGVDIAPQYMTPEMFPDHIMLNGIISIDQNDVITMPGIGPLPPEPIIIPAQFNENGEYEVPEGVDGFNPVTIAVPAPAGAYYRVSIIDGGGNYLFDEFYASGTPVSINELFSYDGAIYRFLYSTDSISSSYEELVTNLPVIQGRYQIRQIYGDNAVEIVGSDLVFSFTGTGTLGIVLSGNEDLKVLYHNFNYRQCGICTKTATLPSVQDRGSGRISFTTPNNDVETTIAYDSRYDFFASGSVLAGNSITIKNFI